MSILYSQLIESLHNTVEKGLSEIGLKNFKVVDFDRGAWRPDIKKIDFKIYTKDSNGTVYFSIDTRTYIESNNNDNYEVLIEISANVKEDYEFNYVNGGSRIRSTELDDAVEEKHYSLYSGNGEYKNDLVGRTIINKAASAVRDYIVDNKETILTRLNTDTIFDHLDEFENLYKDEWEDIKCGSEPVYFRHYHSDFTLMRKEELDDIQYDVPWGTSRGHRKYFRFNGSIYVWFGRDEESSLWC